MNIEFVYRYIVNSHGEIHLVNKYPIFKREGNFTYVCMKNRKGEIEFKPIKTHKILNPRSLMIDAEATLDITDAAYLYYYCNEEIVDRSIF